MCFGGRQTVRPVCVEVALACDAYVPRATPEHWKHQLLKGSGEADRGDCGSISC